MKYKNKEYYTIIWDWRSTIFDPINECIYDWVDLMFKTLSEEKHILVSWTNNIPKRNEQIYSFPIIKKFKNIYITNTSKREIFEKIFDEDGIDADKTMIVGDNPNDEILIAKDLGVDSVLVKDFVKDLGLIKVDN